MPDSEKIQQLSAFVANFGYTIKMNADEEIHPKEIQKLMKKVDGTAEEALISRLALRSMKQAKYTVGCEGHFGLAMKYYCHFTSPIRRYPDLQIHRIIKENLHGKLADKRLEHYQKILSEVAERSSMMERRADDAEREVEKMKKAEYMEQFIGETFEGIISGVTSWGMYVELPNTIEGMVHIADIPGDYYYFEEEKYQMVGERTHRIFKLGQSIQVTVDAVDKLLRTIDFVIAEEEEGMEAADGSGSNKEVAEPFIGMEPDAVVEPVDQAEENMIAPVEKRQGMKKEISRKIAMQRAEEEKRKRQGKSGKKAVKKVEEGKVKKAAKSLSAKKKEMQERKAKLAKKEEVEKAFAKKAVAKKKAELVAKEVSKLTGAAKRKAAKRKKMSAKRARIPSGKKGK